MTGVQILYLVILGLCVLGSGYFSGSETAFVALPRERVHQLDGSRRSRRVVALVTDPERMLSTLLVANNFVNILGAAVATVLFVDLIGEDWGPWLATAAVTSVILVVGEIGPKSLASRFPERYALIVAPSIWRLSMVLRPFARMFQAAAAFVFRPFGLRLGDTRPAITQEDIRALAVLSEQAGGIHATEREIIHALFGLESRPVREVMTPRVDVVNLEWPATVAAVRAAVAETGHSRYPVVRGDMDRLLGVLYAKDLLGLPADPTPEQIRGLLREPHYIPETMSVLRVLQLMRARKLAFAIVLDEHGGVEGVVTAKDLLSELVGEMQDEYDPTVPSIVRLAPGEWIADGRLPVEELAATLGCDLPLGDFATAGGLYLHLAGAIPEEGDSVAFDGLRLVVLTMDRRRIDRIRIERSTSA